MRHVHLVDAVDLPDEMPEALGVQRIFADQALQPTLGQIEHRVRVARRGFDFDRADDALVGLHAQHRRELLLARRDAVMRAHQARCASDSDVAARVGFDDEAADVGDAHDGVFRITRAAYEAFAGAVGDKPRSAPGLRMTRRDPRAGTRRQRRPRGRNSSSGRRRAPASPCPLTPPACFTCARDIADGEADAAMARRDWAPNCARSSHDAATSRRASRMTSTTLSRSTSTAISWPRDR